LAAFLSGGWEFFAPREGWLAWIADTGALLVHTGAQWSAATALPETVDRLGINTAADAINRLAVTSDATLLTHAGAGHQLKVNKAAPGDTASLLFQTGWSGRAEMGLTGSDDFEIKTSADGSVFRPALRIDAATGRPGFPLGADGLSPGEFGATPLVTQGYVAARGTDLVANGTGLLGNRYNYPAGFTIDREVTPNLPASFAFAGHNAGIAFMEEDLPIDPNRVYRLASYLRQESVPGDWSAFADGERHQQYMGLLCRDADGLDIQAHHHMRFHHAGTDSRTVLTAPLAPGDTLVEVADAGGWNENSSPFYNRGLILFGYRNGFGYTYDHYSRLSAFDLFDLGAVDKSAGTITLRVPLPAEMGNPADPAGIWPVGTPVANTTSGSAYKYAFYSAFTPPQTDTWYSTLAHIGGIDRSGTNVGANFPPGTAFARPFWLPNYSNRVGGWSGRPDTGTAQRVWVSGVSVTPEPLAAMQVRANGAVDIKVPATDFASGALSMQTAASSVTAI
jgi:hypothetical protein